MEAIGQTRRHCDLDLVIGDDDALYQYVAHLLACEGFRFVAAYHNTGIPIPWCHVWRHDAGYTVEVLPVPLHKPPFAADGADVADVGQPFTYLLMHDIATQEQKPMQRIRVICQALS